MNFKLCTLALIAAVGTASLTSCTDNDYDLGDIDTTVRIEVNDLTLPAKIDPIYLKSVIDTDDESDIRVVDGYYAIEKKGTFHSSPIKIDPVKLPKPTIPAAQMSIITNGATLPAGLEADFDFNINTAPVDFSYHTSGVPHEILSIDRVGTNMVINIYLGFADLDGLIRKLTLSNLKMALPKGLEIKSCHPSGTYDAQTGTLLINSVSSNTSSVNISLEVEGIDSRSGYVLNTDGNNHTLTFEGALAIIDGNAHIQCKNNTSSAIALPNPVKFSAKFEMSEISVNTFSGAIFYSISGFAIPNVDLSSLPDVLSQEGTDITLVNPQLYLKLNNPVGEYGLSATAGMSITPYRGEVASESCILPESSILLAPVADPTEKIDFCLSPAKPDSYISGFCGSQWIEYASLGRILAGNGLPSYLKVDLLNPMINGSSAVNFPLGKELPSVDGNYTFFTPLNLREGSTIIYSDTEDGWWSEDLDYLTITDLHVRALISTDVPIAVNFTGYPIDRFGHRIGNVIIEGASVPANADNVPIDIHITGAITGIDGIKFVATGTFADNQELKENQNLVITNLKATASGYYTKEL